MKDLEAAVQAALKEINGQFGEYNVTFGKIINNKRRIIATKYNDTQMSIATSATEVEKDVIRRTMDSMAGYRPEGTPGSII